MSGYGKIIIANYITHYNINRRDAPWMIVKFYGCFERIIHGKSNSKGCKLF